MPPGKSPFAVQEKIRRLYYDKILTRLDELFSELVTGDVIIRLDRLDLDLGSVDGERLEQDLVQKTIRAAEKILKGKLQFGTAGSQGMDVIPAEKSTADLLLYFLEFGRLPWWSRVEDLGSLEAGIMDKGSVSAGLRTKFPALMEEVPAARQRLLFQFSGPFLQFMLTSCFPGAASGSREENVAWFKAFYEETGNVQRKENEKGAGERDKTPGKEDTDREETDLDIPDRQKVRRQAGEEETIAGGDAKSMKRTEQTTGDETTLSENTATKAGPEGQSPIKREQATTGGNMPDGTAPPESDVARRSRSEMPATNPLSPAADSAPLPDNNAAVRKEEQAPESPGTKPPHRKDRRQTGSHQSHHSHQDDKEPIYAELAGLVILQPFLAEFFNALHLVEGKSFRDEASRNKAVFLLGHLATGSAEIQEHRLVFPKVLCGMELTAPIERTGIITPEEMEEAVSLLTTVISYWTALKSTTPDGLRNSFLQREGKLSRKDDGWQLDVEKKTLDILLGKLPWGFSITRLPWMKEMIFVNWG